jgi:hypothetical protein
MVGDAPQPGLLEPGFAGLADLLAAAFVLVVEGDAADAGVQAHRVVLLSHAGELGAEGTGSPNVASARCCPRFG